MSMLTLEFNASNLPKKLVDSGTNASVCPANLKPLRVLPCDLEPELHIFDVSADSASVEGVCITLDFNPLAVFTVHRVPTVKRIIIVSCDIVPH